MSKAQKSNKENKKPKADKNRIKKVSAYKAAQSQGKPVRTVIISRSEKGQAMAISPKTAWLSAIAD